jgi:DNA-binding SARP family transcriptional activator
MFDIQLFGRIEVRTRGVRLAGADFGGDRPRHLLALLALRGEVSISELAELLGTGKKSVEADLSVLRAHLEPGVNPRESAILAHRGRLRLDPERVRVDVARFDELIAAAAGRPAGRAVKPLTAAAFLATRPLLEDEDEPWAAELRNEYRAKLVMARHTAAEVAVK